MNGDKDRTRVLGIVGSPRRGGNTEILVDEVLSGAAEGGAVVEKIILTELAIAPCQGCDACYEIGDCVQQDDMQVLFEKMQHSQVWVLGTPIYYYGPTAQFKTFLDRWYGAHHGGIVSFKGKRAILAIPLEDTKQTSARHTTGMFQGALDWLKMELFATVVAPGAHKPGDVRNYPDVLDSARVAGKKVIETMESSK
ncbi:MAG: flavodoxin family protein [Gemmatimonadota bacterium]|nr:MAG: flavodoxin family protein [Gemmatimonadota bacterium]